MAVQSFKGSTEIVINQHPESATVQLQVPVSQVGGGLASASLEIIAAGPMIPVGPDQWGQPNSTVTLKDNDAGTLLFQDFSAQLTFTYNAAKQIVGVAGGGREADLDYAIESSVIGADFIVEMHRATVQGVRGALNVMAAIKA
jgi:hypothetical protein